MSRSLGSLACWLLKRWNSPRSTEVCTTTIYVSMNAFVQELVSTSPIKRKGIQWASAPSPMSSSLVAERPMTTSTCLWPEPYNVTTLSKILYGGSRGLLSGQGSSIVVQHPAPFTHRWREKSWAGAGQAASGRYPFISHWKLWESDKTWEELSLFPSRGSICI